MNCPCCGGPNNKPLASMPAVLHCQDCGYLWNSPSTMTPEGLRAGDAWGYSTTTDQPTPEELKAAGCTWKGLDPKPAIPENGPPLDYDERDFAVCLASRIFAKDIVHDRTNGDIVRRDDRRDKATRRMLEELHKVCPDH